MLSIRGLLIWTIINAHSQLKANEIEAHNLVDSGGWISAFKVQGMGPKPKNAILEIKLAVYLSRNS